MDFSRLYFSYFPSLTILVGYSLGILS